ncbi:Transposon TX1 uncharacterized 149 kDa protein [Vitis vinifera]|uniref:Transposon TX1 uncharacterized 149 kDa protein n=1 Tax=Vitis vinifera TaxID=29760 RepID=A0A438BQ15_VITVI|nr:Transposon TX1 uncharacterized 149 kDa protein [Vitis vinifera]
MGIMENFNGLAAGIHAFVVVGMVSSLKTGTYADVAKSKTGRLGDKVWLELGRRVMLGRLEQLDRCLVVRPSVVLARGKRRVKDNVLFLEKWHPEVGCFCNGANANEAWVRVVGLPLHLWSREVFKLIGDGCGGFIAVDENTNSMAELQWARMLVKVVGRDLPTSVQIVVGWCRRGSLFGKGPSVDEEEVGGGSRAACKGKCGKGGSVQGADWSTSCAILWKLFQKVFQAFPLTPLKGGLVLRATEEASRAKVSEDEGVACFHGGDLRDLEVFLVNARAMMTDDALAAEASRYDSFPAIFGGDRDIFSSTPSSGCDQALVVGGVSGSEGVDTVEGEREVLGSSWDESSLVKFSKSLGFTTEGVEGEILKLLLRLKNRRDQGKKRGTLGLTRFPNERRRGGRVSPSMRRFSEVIDDLDLRDLPLQGGPFTWSGGLNNQAMSRLDRFLVSEDWEGNFNGVVQCTLLRPMFNHFPILLDGEGFVLAKKLKALKAILKTWNKDVFGKVGVNKRLALDKVNFWDSQEKLRSLLVEELEVRKEAKGDFEKWVLMEEISWRKKSREVWLREGDRNTSFFHRMTNSHRRRNCLSKSKINGTWLTEEQEIKGGVVRAFKNLLTDPGDWHLTMEGLDFNRIDVEEATRLEEVFTEEEVFSALSDLNGDKAPGPDGFPLSFWQSCWEFVKEEVMGFLKEFHEHDKFVKSLNSTFLVLIPKKAGAEDLRDFRPISLMGGLYKLLAKVLANKLKKVVGKVVSSAQNAFVEGRQILDATLIANEAIDFLLKRNESGVLCKLDIEKAYDHLNWNFLLFVMRSMGFGEKGTGWIYWCISTATFSVLINGTPAGFSTVQGGCVRGIHFLPTFCDRDGGS